MLTTWQSMVMLNDANGEELSRYESYLSNEVLYILVSQEVAKIFEVKVGGRKENCQLGPSRTRFTLIHISLELEA